MLSRRKLLGAVSILAMLLISPAQGWRTGLGPPPANATIPVTSLADGNYPANNWAGFVRTSDSSSLKFIQIATAQTDVTISGSYPGAGGCSTSLDGLLQAPDYVGGSPEYGAMAVYSDAARTIVSGIRIKGTAIGSPGHSGHFGNISLGGATSQANNNVADVIQSGPSLSGNQTNAAYGGC